MTSQQTFHNEFPGLAALIVCGVVICVLAYLSKLPGESPLIYHLGAFIAACFAYCLTHKDIIVLAVSGIGVSVVYTMGRIGG